MRILVVGGGAREHALVWTLARDGSHELPQPREADVWAEGGRGLGLVERLSDDWGVDLPHRALVHALNKAHHADRLEATSLNAIYLWGV